MSAVEITCPYCRGDMKVETRADGSTLISPPSKDVLGIPPDLRAALAGWWRAHHHGTREEERMAEEALCDAISPRIEALREMVHGNRS